MGATLATKLVVGVPSGRVALARSASARRDETCATQETAMQLTLDVLTVN